MAASGKGGILSLREPVWLPGAGPVVAGTLADDADAIGFHRQGPS